MCEGGIYKNDPKKDIFTHNSFYVNLWNSLNNNHKKLEVLILHCLEDIMSNSY